ncbi:glycosyltransferase family 2 protein [Pseudomonas sp. ArH3a]|uniref:glycosyltransferase family 2 protein n=1 Tax=Pseudomonas sp. ArH3a TaxID=2862945 RepID=UPI001F57E911|nr:glycosyltransferase family 2 protein [Pseudomonas sp. ArH3a]
MSIYTLRSPSAVESHDFCTAKVAVLMCTYNGESYLAEQLDSFERQTYANWALVVSDDGSHDATLSLLNDYSARWGAERLKVVGGPKRGFAANFLSLTCRDDIEADFFAWSDQDDIWTDDKLEVALAWLQTIPTDVPALYCGRTQLISELGEPIGFSPRFLLPPGFPNALVQSIAGGNTMVFNQAARDLLREAGADLVLPAHDWWAYQLVSGAGGVIHYDPEPKMLYRQHSENLIGSNSGWTARLVRLRMVFQGRFYEWNEQNIRALESMEHRLCEEHLATLVRFKVARGQTFIRRVLGIRLAGLYRQTFMGNLGLTLATLLKKI